jgi:hypothetical protein
MFLTGILSGWQCVRMAEYLAGNMSDGNVFDWQFVWLAMCLDGSISGWQYVGWQCV